MTFFEWLDIDSLVIELIEFKDNSTWMNNFNGLGEVIEDVECTDTNFCIQKSENLSLEI